MKNAARILPTQQLKKDGHRIVLPAAEKKKKNSRSYKNDMFVLLFHKRHGHYFCFKKKKENKDLFCQLKKKNLDRVEHPWFSKQEASPTVHAELVAFFSLFFLTVFTSQRR